MPTFASSLVTPERIVFEEEVTAVILRTDVGEATFLTGHTPLIGALVPGPGALPARGRNRGAGGGPRGIRARTGRGGVGSRPRGRAGAGHRRRPGPAGPGGGHPIGGGARPGPGPGAGERRRGHRCRPRAGTRPSRPRRAEIRLERGRRPPHRWGPDRSCRPAGAGPVRAVGPRPCAGARRHHERGVVEQRQHGVDGGVVDGRPGAPPRPPGDGGKTRMDWACAARRPRPRWPRERAVADVVVDVAGPACQESGRCGPRSSAGPGAP